MKPMTPTKKPRSPAKKIPIVKAAPEAAESTGDMKKNQHGATRQAGVAGSQKSKFPARYELISTIGLRRLAETHGEGSIKYGDNNWLNGMEDKDLLNHALAHINLYRAGDRTEDHLAHASWNLFACMHFEETRPELMTLQQDLPPGAHR
jgi:hypothetical protein